MVSKSAHSKFVHELSISAAELEDRYRNNEVLQGCHAKRSTHTCLLAWGKQAPQSKCCEVVYSSIQQFVRNGRMCTRIILSTASQGTCQQ
jgi:hypothetical protein